MRRFIRLMGINYVFQFSIFTPVRRPICLERISTRLSLRSLLLVALVIATTWRSFGQTLRDKTSLWRGKLRNSCTWFPHTVYDTLSSKRSCFPPSSSGSGCSKSTRRIKCNEWKFIILLIHLRFFFATDFLSKLFDTWPSLFFNILCIQGAPQLAAQASRGWLGHRVYVKNIYIFDSVLHVELPSARLYHQLRGHPVYFVVIERNIWSVYYKKCLLRVLYGLRCTIWLPNGFHRMREANLLVPIWVRYL